MSLSPFAAWRVEVVLSKLQSYGKVSDARWVTTASVGMGSVSVKVEVGRSVIWIWKGGGHTSQ